MKFPVIVIFLFAATAVMTWAAFLRSVPIQTATGTIVRKMYKPSGTYWQYPVGVDRGFRTATPIPIAEAYVFEIALAGLRTPVYFSLNTVASKAFDVGEKVQVRYRERGFLFTPKRVYIIDMQQQ